MTPATLSLTVTTGPVGFGWPGMTREEAEAYCLAHDLRLTDWQPGHAVGVPPGALVCRLLPSDEWPRLHAIEPFKSKGLPDDPDNWVVLVVERDGAIVGTTSLFTAMHWDCWYVDPQQPGPARGVILRQLLRESIRAFRLLQVQQLYCGADDDGPPAVVPLLERFGFAPAPGRLFILQVDAVSAALCKETGHGITGVGV